MSEYDNTNRGSIWKNNDRTTEKHPHFKGTLNVDGAEYWVSAWKRDKDSNPKAPALTFSINLKDNQSYSSPANTVDDDDEDVPF